MIDSSLFNLIYKRRLCRPLSRHLSRHFGQNIITPPSGIIGLDFLMVSSFLSSLPSLLIVHTLCACPTLHVGYLSLSRFSIFLYFLMICPSLLNGFCLSLLSPLNLMICSSLFEFIKFIKFSCSFFNLVVY
jgi:hypothetical protein